MIQLAMNIIYIGDLAVCNCVLCSEFLLIDDFQKLCNDLTKSENRIGALREDVVRLEDDIYMTKRNRTCKR